MIRIGPVWNISEIQPFNAAAGKKALLIHLWAMQLPASLIRPFFTAGFMESILQPRCCGSRGAIHGTLRLFAQGDRIQ